jgi:hypothetical protein
LLEISTSEGCESWRQSEATHDTDALLDELSGEGKAFVAQHWRLEITNVLLGRCNRRAGTDLPLGYRMIWTGMQVLKHDGSRHHDVGITPTVKVSRSIQGIREGRDEQLDRGLSLLP